MGSITIGFATYPFVSLEGAPLEPMSIGVEVINREGIDGVDVRKSAKRPRPVEKISFMDCADIDEAEGLVNDFLAMKGEVVTVTEDTSRVCSNILVQDVNIVEIKPLAKAVGGLVPGATYSVRARWTLLPVNPEGL